MDCTSLACCGSFGATFFSKLRSNVVFVLSRGTTSFFPLMDAVVRALLSWIPPLLKHSKSWNQWQIRQVIANFDGRFPLATRAVVNPPLQTELRKAMMYSTGGVHVLWLPPGCGKTYTMRSVAQELLEEKRIGGAIYLTSLVSPAARRQRSKQDSTRDSEFLEWSIRSRACFLP